MPPTPYRPDPLSHFSGAKWTTLYAAGAVIALVAWILNVAQLYWMAATMFLLPQLSRLFSWLEQLGLDLDRQLPASAGQGDVVTVRLHAVNHAPLPKLHVFITDELPAGLTPLEPMPLAIQVPPRGETTLSYQLRAGRRGLHRLNTLRLQSMDLLGISIRGRAIPAPAEIVVYPRVVPLPESLIPPRAESGRASEETAARKGDGAGFYGIREYRPGDPLRHVHWRTAARLGRLTVVEWEAEEARDTALVVDTRASVVADLGDGTTLDAAAGLAASLAYALLERGDLVHLLAPGTTPPHAPPMRGTAAFRDLLDSLARMGAEEQLTPLAAVRELAVRVAAGTRICWITPVLDEEYFASVQLLQGSGLAVTTYLLSAVEAEHPESSGREVPGAAGETVFPLHRGDSLVSRLLG